MDVSIPRWGPNGRTTGPGCALPRHVSTGARRIEAINSVQVIGEDTFYVIKIFLGQEVIESYGK